jgi:hypothetical protein
MRATGLPEAVLRAPDVAKAISRSEVQVTTDPEPTPVDAPAATPRKRGAE